MTRICDNYRALSDNCLVQVQNWQSYVPFRVRPMPFGVRLCHFAILTILHACTHPAGSSNHQCEIGFNGMHGCSKVRVA